MLADKKRGSGNKPGRKKVSRPLGRCGAIDPGLTVRGTDVDTDRLVVWHSHLFFSIYSVGSLLSFAFPHTLFTHSVVSYRRVNHKEKGR